jgi:Fe-S-cluster containining protein
MPNFTDWNYDTGVATEYERIGECNQCGNCCRATFDLKMSEGSDKRFNGGNGTDGEGQWPEIKEVSDIPHINGNREFVAFVLRRQNPNPPCYALDPETNLCTINSGFSKPWCCSIFPTAPSDIANLPNCSYEFIKVNEHAIEELEYESTYMLPL